MLDFLKRGQVRYEEMVHLQELNRSWFYTLLMHVGKQLDQVRSLVCWQRAFLLPSLRRSRHAIPGP